MKKKKGSSGGLGLKLDVSNRQPQQQQRTFGQGYQGFQQPDLNSQGPSWSVPEGGGFNTPKENLNPDGTPMSEEDIKFNKIKKMIKKTRTREQMVKNSADSQSMKIQRLKIQEEEQKRRRSQREGDTKMFAGEGVYDKKSDDE